MRRRQIDCSQLGDFNWGTCRKQSDTTRPMSYQFEVDWGGLSSRTVSAAFDASVEAAKR